MSKQELAELERLLDKFLQWQDERAALSIEKASCIQSAVQREVYWAEQKSSIRYVKNWAHAAQIGSG